MSTVKKAASIVISVVMWIIILVAALFAFTTLATKDDGSVSSLAGFTPLTVQSESMAPTFDQDDLIIIKQCDPSTLEVGDIVTFHAIIDNQYALNTHRIISINEVTALTATPPRATTTSLPTSTSSQMATSWASTWARSRIWARSSASCPAPGASLR